ncbi:MAG: GNAT family N-acetyltransferase [Sphingomonas sp.]|nr:GNAT family N-acetyltransferase [Sphingomonas sp.]
MMIPVLTTKRLILRLPEAADLDGWAAFSADPETMAYLGGVQSRAESWRALCTMRGAWDIRGFAMFSVIERDTGRWVGRIGPWQPEGWPGREVGWGVAREFAGRGYAHEAASAAMDYAFDVLGWDRVIHTIDPDNTRSAALARRLGSRKGERVTLPPPLSDHVVDAWGQSADEWRARRGA